MNKSFKKKVPFVLSIIVLMITCSYILIAPPFIVIGLYFIFLVSLLKDVERKLQANDTDNNPERIRIANMLRSMAFEDRFKELPSARGALREMAFKLENE